MRIEEARAVMKAATWLFTVNDPNKGLVVGDHTHTYKDVLAKIDAGEYDEFLRKNVELEGMNADSVLVHVNAGVSGKVNKSHMDGSGVRIIDEFEITELVFSKKLGGFRDA